MKKLVANILRSSVTATILLLASAGIAHASTAITSCTDLQNIPSGSTSTFVLANDITCSGTFTQISTFKGTLDGNYHTITNLHVSGTNNVGMFGTGDGATFQNLTFQSPIASGNFVVSVLMANASGTTVTNVSMINTHMSSGALISVMGALAGGAGNGSTFTYDHVNVTSASGFSEVGGLVGGMNGTSTISNSYADGVISIAKNGTVSQLGGLVGLTQDSAIDNSYASMTVVGTGDFVGGLVGENAGNGSITHSYANGHVTGSGSNIGGLVGATTGTASVATSYFDASSTGQLTSGGGTAENTAQMQTQGTFAGWDFTNIWNISLNSYPILRAFDITPPSAPGTPTATSPTSSTTPTVSWTAATDDVSLAATPYTVQWSTSSTFGGSLFSTTTASTSLAPTSSLAEGTWYFRVKATDRAGNSSAYATSSGIIIDLTAPVITLNGSATVTDTFGTFYSDAGATANDSVDGNLTSSIIKTGSVNVNVAGNYTLFYDVSDAAGNAATEVTRTVTVQAQVQQQQQSSGGGGAPPPIAPVATVASGGTGAALDFTVNGSSSFPVQTSAQTITLGLNGDPGKVKGYAASTRADFYQTNLLPLVASASFALPSAAGTYTVYVKYFSTTGMVSQTISHVVIYAPAGGSLVVTPSQSMTGSFTVTPSSPASNGRHYAFGRNLRRGMSGADVQALQQFLNAHGFIIAKSGPGSPGHESTSFGPATAKALAAFQEKYADQILKPFGLTKGTGLFLTATRNFVNSNF